jgi:hypothetical protein
MEAHYLRKTARDYGNEGVGLYGLRWWECMMRPEVGIHGRGERQLRSGPESLVEAERASEFRKLYREEVGDFQRATEKR